MFDWEEPSKGIILKHGQCGILVPNDKVKLRWVETSVQTCESRISSYQKFIFVPRFEIVKVRG